jgi:hypothetical protein
MEKGFTIIQGQKIFKEPKFWLQIKEDIMDKMLLLEENGIHKNCISYSLDYVIFIDIISRVLKSEVINNKICNYLESPNYFIKFIRYRAPEKNYGLQRYHRDWLFNHPEKRIELFIICDDMSKENGGIEIIENSHKEHKINYKRKVSISAKESDCIIMDSTCYHRGTKNIIGSKRGVIDVHIGVNPTDEENEILSFLTQNNDCI